VGRLLIVNADDLGWSVEVNAGIIASHVAGVVSSVTLTATMPGADDAVDRLKDCPELGVGVHLTLTAGKPVCSDESVRARLAPGGDFGSSLLKLLVCARRSGSWREAAEAELSAQVQWLLDRGIKPDHVDSHKHFHVVSPFSGMVARVARGFGIACVRNTCERRVRLGNVRLSARLRRRLLMHWGKQASKVFAGQGLVSPGAFFGIADTGRPSVARVKAFLETCRAGSVEWMVHPGELEPTPSAVSRLGASRPVEKKMLTSPEVRAMIAESGFELVRYQELTA